MDNINNFIMFQKEIDNFEKIIFPKDIEECLKNISNLFAEMSDPAQKKEAINIVKEKIFEHLNIEYALTDTVIIKSISSLIQHAPEDLKNLYLDKEHLLSVEDYQSIQRLKTGQKEEKLQVLQEILNRHQKDIQSIMFDKIPLDEIVIAIGDVELIKHLLNDEKYATHIKNEFYPLLICLKNKDIDGINVFLEFYKNEKKSLNDFRIDIVDLIIQSKLNSADMISLIKKTFEGGCSVNGNQNTNYLCSAIEFGQEKVIDFLLEKGVDINRIDVIRNNNPIWEALLNKDYASFEKLLERKADTDVNYYSPTLLREQSILDYAFEKEDLEACRLLNKYAPNIVNPLLKKGMNVIMKMKISRDINKEKSKAYKQFDILKNQSKVEMKIKEISHSHSIKGFSPLLSRDVDRFVNLEGMLSFEFYKSLDKTMKNYLEKIYPNFPRNYT